MVAMFTEEHKKYLKIEKEAEKWLNSSESDANILKKIVKIIVF